MSDSDKQKKDDKELSSEDIQEVGETIEKLSKREPELVSQLIAMTNIGGLRNPLHEKLTEEHIGKIVDLTVEHDKRQFQLHINTQSNEHQDKQSDKKYYFAYYALSAIIFLIVLYSLKDTPDILIPTLTGLGGLASGFLAGLGFRKKS